VDDLRNSGGIKEILRTTLGISKNLLTSLWQGARMLITQSPTGDPRGNGSRYPGNWKEAEVDSDSVKQSTGEKQYPHGLRVAGKGLGSTRRKQTTSAPQSQRTAGLRTGSSFGKAGKAFEEYHSQGRRVRESGNAGTASRPTEYLTESDEHAKRQRGSGIDTGGGSGKHEIAKRQRGRGIIGPTPCGRLRDRQAATWKRDRHWKHAEG